MKKHLIPIITGLSLGSLTAMPTTLVQEDFTYADGNVDTVGTAGTGWDVAEGGWQTGNSLAASNRFNVQTEAAIYTGGGVGTYTEQNRTFAASVTATTTDTIELSFDLIRNETQAGRGIGIYLTNGGANEFFIGKEVNGGVGLHGSMASNTDTIVDFATTGAVETITATITYDGVDTSIVLSDSNETLTAHTVSGAFTFDGISLAAYNGSTLTNGIDDILITTTPDPDPWASVETAITLDNNGGAQSYSIPITNLGSTQALTISAVTAVGSDSPDVSSIVFPATIASGANDNISFTFTPTLGTGLYAFDLEIVSNDQNAPSPLIIAVDLLVSDPIIDVDVVSVDFGALSNDPGVQTSNVTISNLGGSEPLEISALTLVGSAAFTITSPPSLPITVPAGGSQIIEISFDPGTQPGNFTGSLTIVSDDFGGAEPVIDLAATTALGDNIIADFDFGSGATLDLSSSDTALGTLVSDLTETDLGSRTEFGLRVVNGTANNTPLPSIIEGNSLGWSRREAPNTGLDLTAVAPTEALSFTVTPAPGYTVDLTTDGWLTVDLGAYSEIAGPTAYDFALTVDDGVNPAFTLGPVVGPGLTGSNQEESLTLAFDVRSLGVITAPVDFILMPQTTANSNGLSSQTGGFVDNITLSAIETAPLDPILLVTSPSNFTNDGVAEGFSIPIQNVGLGELTITSVTTDGSGDASAFSAITFDTPLSASGGSGTIDFNFDPTSIGEAKTYTTNLTIVSNDPSSPTTVALEVSVEDPEAVFPSSFTFAATGPNPALQNGTIIVLNEGEIEDLIISDATISSGSGAFGVVSIPATSIPAGGSGDIEISFNPGTTSGLLEAVLTVTSNDFGNPTTDITLVGFSDPAGTVVARFDFDPSSEVSNNPTIDVDGSSLTNWTTSDLTDLATGNGALSSSNQGNNNRGTSAGFYGNYLALSSAREGDAQTPLAGGGNNESTWTTFTITPDEGGGEIDFTGGTAVVDTYAATDQLTNTGADWTLYYSLDGGSSWTSLGTLTGATTTSTTEVLGLKWDLSPIGNQTIPVDFIIDPVSTGNTNGTANQRRVGFDNLIVTAGSVTPGTAADFSTWASGFSIPNDPDYDAGDSDGITALMEYALGLSPLVSESLADTFDSTTGELSFTKGAEAVTNGDITYSIETSTDLGAWVAVDELDLEEGTASDPSSISYILPTGAGTIFARLSVLQP